MMVGFKTISLAEDAYVRLAAMRGPGESFTDVVRRLAAPAGRLSDLAGSLSPAAAAAVQAAIGEGRREKLSAKKRRLGLE